MTAIGISKRSRRKQTIWVSVWTTVLGIAVLAALAHRLDVLRDTDRAAAAGHITSMSTDAEDTQVPPLEFHDAAADLGIVMRHGPGKRGRTLPEDTGSGLAWGDYDGDGDWDLYIVNFTRPLGARPIPDGRNRLFRNDGRRFHDVTDQAGVGDRDGFGMGATFADYDDDGDQDLYVTNFGPNCLFRNRGDGTFEEVAHQAGVDDPSWSTGCAWGDYDRDGDLDLYVCNYVDYDLGAIQLSNQDDTAFGPYVVPFALNPNSFDPAPNRLYRNRGDGTFEEVASSSGVDDTTGRSFAATFVDLDGDGWLDLYVTNDVSPNRLFHNLGAAQLRPAGTGPAPPQFVDRSAMTGTADARGSMGLAVAELGGMIGRVDGLPDLFITHWVTQENAMYLSTPLPRGNLEYRDKTRQFRLGEISIPYVGWGCCFADFDRDGRADLAVANGSTLEQKEDLTQLIPEPLLLFWNDGKRFHNVADRAGPIFHRRFDARGLAAADFDGDGDVDLAISVNGGQPLLLRNDTPTSHYGLKIRLHGRSGVCFGARVEVHAAGNRMVQWWGADVTYLGMHAPELIFGLGQAVAADVVRVVWADRSDTTLHNVPAGLVVIDHTQGERLKAEG